MSTSTNSSSGIATKLGQFRTVKDIMTAWSVYFVTPDDTLEKAFTLMAKNDIRGLPVVTHAEPSKISSLDDVSSPGGEICHSITGPQYYVIIRKTYWNPKVVGILTDRDLRLAADSPFLHRSSKQVLENLAKHKVSEVMTKGLVTLEPSDSIVDAAKMMRVSKIAQAPVVENGQLVGMLSRTDLIDHLIRLLEP